MRLIFTFALVGLFTSTMVSAQTDRDFMILMDRNIEHASGIGGTSAHYGDGYRQTLSINKGRPKHSLPVLFIIQDFSWYNGSPGYGLGLFVSRLVDNGIAVVAMDGRDDNLQMSLTDVHSALAYIISHSYKEQLNSGRIVIMGIGSRARFAAQIGADPAKFKDSGLDTKSIRAVVLLEGVGLTTMESARATFPDEFKRFANSPAYWDATSPLKIYVPDSNIPFYLLNSVKPASAANDAAMFAKTLMTTNVQAETHTMMSKTGRYPFGAPGNAPSNDIFNFIVNKLTK